MTSAELAREADASRDRLAKTLYQLRDHLAPQHLIDEMFERIAGPGGSSAFKRVESVIRDHPLPMMLMGAGGVLWMRSGPRKSAARSRGNGEASPPDSAESSLRENLAAVSWSFANDAYQRIRASVSATLDGYAKTATEGIEAASERISGMLEGTLDKTISTGPLTFSLVVVALGTALGHVRHSERQ